MSAVKTVFVCDLLFAFTSLQSIQWFVQKSTTRALIISGLPLKCDAARIGEDTSCNMAAATLLIQ